MTGKERIATAMDLGVPDRVPFMCQCSIGHLLLQLGISPVEFWNDVYVFSDGLIRISVGLESVDDIKADLERGLGMEKMR